MKSKVYRLAMVSVMMFGVLRARGQGTETSATPSKPVLVELFTSEGCSSCPPADALLRQINNRQTRSGQLIIALSEHVTYWNRLGWVDPFSQDLFTQRQSAYGDRFRLDSVYTPQIIVNGDAQVLGSDGAAVERAVQAETAHTGVKLNVVHTEIQQNVLQITFWVEADIHAPAAEIYAVLADDMATSQVARGENSGRTLTHVAVARSLTRIGSIARSSMPIGRAQTVTVPLPLALAGQLKTGRHLVLFAQQGNAGKVLAVDSKAI